MTTYTDKQLVREAGRHIEDYPKYCGSAIGTAAVFCGTDPGKEVGEYMFISKSFKPYDCELLRDLANGTADESVANAVEFIFGGDVEPNEDWAPEKESVAVETKRFGRLRIYEIEGPCPDELVELDNEFEQEDRLEVRIYGDSDTCTGLSASLRGNSKSYGSGPVFSVENFEDALKAVGFDSVVEAG